MKLDTPEAIRYANFDFDRSGDVGGLGECP